MGDEKIEEKPKKKNNPWAESGFFLGLLSVSIVQLLVVAFSIVFLLMPILGIIISIIGLHTFKTEIEKNKWMAWWGLGLNICFFFSFWSMLMSHLG